MARSGMNTAYGISTGLDAMCTQFLDLYKVKRAQSEFWVFSLLIIFII
jgi:hypothetical protein